MSSACVAGRGLPSSAEWGAPPPGAGRRRSSGPSPPPHQSPSRAGAHQSPSNGAYSAMAAARAEGGGGGAGAGAGWRRGPAFVLLLSGLSLSLSSPVDATFPPFLRLPDPATAAAR
ncbi:unnamed protein product [Urochloa humidicola]